MRADRSRLDMRTMPRAPAPWSLCSRRRDGAMVFVFFRAKDSGREVCPRLPDEIGLSIAI